MSLQNQNPQPRQQSQTQTPIAWRYAGDQVKRWRTKAGLSREELGRAAAYAPDTIKSMEQGVRMPTPKLLDAADDLFRAEGLLSAAKQYLRREKFPARAQDFMAHEREAISLWWYEVALIPGLLQTDACMRKLIGGFAPPLGQDVVEERVAARRERQEILTRKPTVACCFVLYESALRGPQVDREQLLHLLKTSEASNISLQVLPFKRAIPVAMDGPMVLLEAGDHAHSVYTEGPFTGELTSDPEQVSLAIERLGMIRMEALGTEASTRFLEQMVNEL
ncbi:helix-turn-helix domain-containing protein [Streptomyces sp. NBC_01429]|uniref:helix-turn-helix domain-containing protein n=1 Tax=Streptomyces sp. NBC_01429 TaxID=2903862 RepID=UPI002E284B55|nr:helix-turn-helix transcriptional regulator [Streptomyces sp. NBC_01429]